MPALEPPRLAKPPPNDPPNELPPNELPPKAGLFEAVKAEKPPPVEVDGAVLPAKEESLAPLAVPKGELEPDLGLASPLNGEAVELAKPPNADDLNLSSDV